MLREVFQVWNVHTEHDDSPRVRNITSVPDLGARIHVTPPLVDRPPKVFAELLEEWGLQPDGEPRSGYTATVLPVLTDEGQPAVLKVGTRHPETEHEHLALQHWHGDGAVLLLRADPRRMALLLERLSHVDLTGVWDVEACEIVAGFYPRLHRPAPPQLMRLSAYVGSYSTGSPGCPGTQPCRGAWSSRRCRSPGPSPTTPARTVG